MSTLALKQLPSSVMIMLASIVAICCTFLAWSIIMRSELDLASLTNWSDLTWQIAEVDSRGRLVRLGAHPFALALLFGFVAASSVSFALAAWQFLNGSMHPKREADEGLSDRLEKVGQELDDEMLSVVRSVQQHLDVSGSHSESLSKATEGLLSSASPERIRGIVQFLVSENKKVQKEVGELNGRLKQSQQQIEKLRISLSDSHRLGMLDAVTLLKNRHWLEVHLPKEVKTAADANESLCIIMADVDHFKRINDTFGHAVGDEILRRFAELLSKNIRAEIPPRAMEAKNSSSSCRRRGWREPRI